MVIGEIGAYQLAGVKTSHYPYPSLVDRFPGLSILLKGFAS
jgi:hypothetical protein